MGWSSLCVAMRYIHPSDERVLEAISLLGGHNSRHTNDARKLVARTGRTEVVEQAGDFLMSTAGFEPATHALKKPAARQINNLACINESQLIATNSTSGAGFSQQHRSLSQP